MDKQVVLITGGSRGQGRQHAITFAENGFDIVLGDIAPLLCRSINQLKRFT